MQELLKNIHESIVTQIIPGANLIPIHLVYIAGLAVAGGIILVWMALIAMGWIYAERRIAGFIQARVGPNRVGPYGTLQSLADGIKLLTKEDIIPATANRFLFEMAPLLVFAGAFIPFAVLPFSQHFVIADMDLGLFYVLAFGALEVMGVMMAGWAPNSKWSLYGGMRLAAQMLSYEIPLALSAIVIVVLSGSLNLTEIIQWQTSGAFILDFYYGDGAVQTWWVFDWLNWGIFRSPAAFVGFFIFFIAGLAETKRAPFDLPEAESELVSGFHTEYSGIRFSFFFLAEYASMYVICILTAILFLGGWHWPIPLFDIDGNFIESIGARLADYKASRGEGWFEVAEFYIFWGPLATLEGVLDHWDYFLNELGGFINLIGKAFVLLFVMLWIRWTLPRIRIDQVMHTCLKVLLPFGLAIVLLAGLQAAMTKPAPPVVDWPTQNATPQPQDTWFMWHMINRGDALLKGYQLVVYRESDPENAVINVIRAKDEPHYRPFEEGALPAGDERYFYQVFPILKITPNPETGAEKLELGKPSKTTYFSVGYPEN